MATEFVFGVPLREVLRSQQVGILSLQQAIYLAVSYTHLRAHETVLDLVCRLLLEKKTESSVLPANIMISAGTIIEMHR